ncbi:class I SAM-dependent methyltransferase [Deferrisoma camini]|uniref:class I SAM-dependent methyltransferase n=1 Tax=Deferrisoma camini TaxID=1035120 RepID=UPI000A02D28A|nr:class I SAM-dependent methyltransferase [Deferrisoma camini]
MNSHPIKRLLIELGISGKDSFRDLFPTVRDRDDISVQKCIQSGAIVLSRADHINEVHYLNKNDFEYWGTNSRRLAVSATYEDTETRFHKFRSIISGKTWLDIGAGAGGVLDRFSPLASETVAIEPQRPAMTALRAAGYEVYSSLSEIPAQKRFDVVTLFHVFEHINNPIHFLKNIKKHMNTGGHLIIEVPHANDILISFFDLEDFKKFTFWSEHLILHTRTSLYRFIEAAGFSSIVIEGHQRYPLANHLHWLAKGGPGGHATWHFMRDTMLDSAYANLLARLDKTDSLIATATNS